MKYKGRIKYLIAAGLLAFSVSGCNKEIQGNNTNIQKNTINSNQENTNDDKEQTEQEKLEMEQFYEELKRSFGKGEVILDKSTDKFISNIVIDGRKVSIELVNGKKIFGFLDNLEISDVNFKNFYIYDSKYINDMFNVKTKYQDFKEKGYDTAVEALYADYDNHKKLNVRTYNCSVSNEYKKGDMKDVSWYEEIDYSDSRKLWLVGNYIDEKYLEKIYSMPNLETLIITNPDLYRLDKEIIEINSKTLKNLIIDGTYYKQADHFNFTGCPNLEVLSIMLDSQETNLDGIKGLNKLKQLSFGLTSSKYNVEELILKDFQERIDLISTPFPTDDASLACVESGYISDISAIKGSNIEILNVSFLTCVSSDMLLETIKELPNLKEIVGFEVNNAGMCSDELIEYCEKNKIKHPFTEKSLEIKHKLQEIVSEVITEDMNEEDKIKALSEYIVSHMEYDHDLPNVKYRYSSEKIRKGWGECLYYSVMEESGVCQGYTMYAQNLFIEAGIKTFKINGVDHTWNLIQIDDDYYIVDLTNVDGIVDEENSSSFDDYNLDSYYLVPIDENINFFYPLMLPIEAEKQYEEANEKQKMKYKERIGKSEDIKSGSIQFANYFIQTNKQDLNPKSYSKLCGTIGILCALGLAKKVGSKKDILKKQLDEKNRDGVMKFSSLNEILRRTQRMNKLEEKREEANIEKYRNNEAKKLQEEITQNEKGDNR